MSKILNVRHLRSGCRSTESLAVLGAVVGRPVGTHDQCQPHRTFFWRKKNPPPVDPSDLEPRLMPKSNFDAKEHQPGPGYVVLFPDIPSDTEANNHLMLVPKSGALPKFSQLNIDKCFRAVWKRQIEFDCLIDDIDLDFENKSQKSFEELFEAIESHLVPLDYSMLTLKTLYGSNQRAYHMRNIKKLFARGTQVRSRRFSSHAIYHYVKEIEAGKDSLTPSQQQLVESYLYNCRLNGLNLSPTDKEKLDAVLLLLANKKGHFLFNLEEANRRFRHVVSQPDLLRNLPEELFATVANSSENGTEVDRDQSDGLTITFNPAMIGPFMAYCPDRNLRWNVWNALNLRCSHVVDTNISNSILIDEMRSSKQQQAKLCGYESFPHMMAENKAAGSLDKIRQFIETLHTINSPKAEAKLETLASFVNESSPFTKETSPRLELWDLPYWKRKFLTSKYGVTDYSVNDYFTLPSTIKGVCKLVEKLFNVRIEQIPPASGKKGFDFWSPEVLLFKVITSKGREAGSILLDPYARPGDKVIYNTDHPESLLTTCKSQDTKPLCCIVLNLPRPLSSTHQPPMSFTEVLHTFKKFGQCLKHCLSELPYAEISGIHGQELDVAHFPAHFLSMFPLFDYNLIEGMTQHQTSKEPMSRELHTKLRQSHYFFFSISLQQEVYRMALDLALHSNTQHWNQVAEETWKKYMSYFKRSPKDSHPCSFRQIFVDQYAASYYSLKWSEMMAADCFMLFQEALAANDDKKLQQTGKRFRDTLLTGGKGERTAELYRQFAGRDPTPEPFLSLGDLSEAENSFSLQIDQSQFQRSKATNI